ncbi:MAG: ABC transporter ATP-binding protein [Anaerolineales bacterium]|nr:ABC transporter ATP-binding protein [Anaerolineales bacterium]
MISINNLRVQRNGRDALNIDSLEIKKGETLAVVGPNGAGKSTFLLVLAHLIKPVNGGITFKGKLLRDWDDIEYRRRIAFVFQDPLLMDMSVEDNIALGLKFRGVKKEDALEQVIKWSRAMGVDSLLKRRAGQLSGGEAQRVSLARAFVLDPELLLMDEPFSAVDPQTRTQLLKDLTKVLAQDHRTTIFVTHNLKEAAQFGDRVAVIIDGKLKQVGKPKQIKEKPVDKSVRGFLKGL